MLQSEKLDWLKGKEGEIVRAGACESKIFGVKSEREKESQRSQKSVRQEKTETDDQQRSVFMMPSANGLKCML